MAIVTNVGMGCGGRGGIVHATGWRGGLFGLVSDPRGVRTGGAEAYGEVVWSWRLMVGVKSREKASRPDRARISHLFAGDGDNKSRFSGEITK